MALEEMSKPVRKTFSEVGAEWYKEYGEKRFSKNKPISYSSYESRGYSLKRANEYIGNVYVDEITDAMAEELIEKCSIKPDGSYYSRSSVDNCNRHFNLCWNMQENMDIAM